MITDKDIKKIEKVFATKEDLKNLATKDDIENLVGMTARGFAAVEERFGVLEEKVDGIDTRLSNVEVRVEMIDTRLERVEIQHERRLSFIEDTVQVITTSIGKNPKLRFSK